MNTPKKLTSFMGGAAMIATVVRLTAGLAPASAAPSQTPGATLSIVRQDIVNPDYNRVTLYGVFPMQEPDAVGFVNPASDVRSAA